MLRVVGDILIPIVKPILEDLTKLLNDTADALNSLDGPTKTVIGSVLLLLGGLTILAIVIGTVNTLMNVLGIKSMFVAMAHEAQAIAAGISTGAHTLLAGNYMYGMRMVDILILILSLTFLSALQIIIILTTY